MNEIFLHSFSKTDFKIISTPQLKLVTCQVLIATCIIADGCHTKQHTLESPMSTLTDCNNSIFPPKIQNAFVDVEFPVSRSVQAEAG